MKPSSTGRVLSRVGALLLVLLLTPLTMSSYGGDVLPVTAQELQNVVANGFDYPVGKPDGSGWTFWHGFEHYGAVYAGSYHAGEDWYIPGRRTAYQPVYAIGHGVVKYAGGSYPGNVVIIEHKLPNGETWFSMYGHVNAGVSPNQAVSRGQQVGTIYDWGGNSHLHFEIRDFYFRDEVNGSRSACPRHRNYPPGPGYWPLPRCNGVWSGRPSEKGWVNPSQFINARRNLQTAPGIAVGQNSSRQQVFQIAYEATRQGTMYNINYGTPTTGAYWYHALVRQDFSNGVSLIHDEVADSPANSVPAYPIAGDFRTYWEQNLQQLGPPTSNPIKNGSGQDEQHFRHGRVRRINGRLVFEPWPTEADCVRQGRWRLEVINLFHFYPGGVDTGRGMTWPPNQNLSAGPSMVACIAPTQPGYALFYDVKRESPYFERSTYDQGLWRNHWMARLSGKVSGLPTDGFWPVSAACDDGCVIDIQSKTFPWWRQQIASWRDQPAIHLGRAWVQNDDQVNVTWYEREDMARVWLKQGLQALTLPPLSAQCDARIRIADGAPVINTPATTLTITAADAAEMKVSRLEDLSDASWQPFTTTLDWQLEPATGVMTHTVYAQFRDATEETLCQGAIISDDILLDTLPPTGTATIAANDAISVTLQLDAGDQSDGSGVAYVAIFPVLPDEDAQLSELGELPEEVWQAYEPQITIFKPMTLMGETEVNYRIWFRDAAGNIADPITVVVPQVEPPPPPDKPTPGDPTPDDPTPDDPTPDDPTPDDPTPDDPTPDKPNPPPADERSQSVYLPLVIR